MNKRIITGIALAALLASSAAAADTIAITGATVHTLTDRGVIENATVVVRDGRIQAVGTDVRVPSGARVVDAAGRLVTPGFFDAWSHIGIVEISGIDTTNDAASEDERISAAFNVVDAINPRSVLIPVNRIEGITRTLVVPQARGSLIAGQAVVMDLGGRGDSVVMAPAAMVVQLGERAASMAGGSRAAAMLRLRETLQDARDYGRNRSAFARGSRRAYAASRLDLEALQPVLAGRVPVVAMVNRASDIEALLRLKEEFDLRVVIFGGAEAWMVADRLVAADVPVIVDPLANLPGSFETLASTDRNAALLHEAGVRIAFATSDSHNARNLRQSAGNAVARGLPWDAAMAAVTTNAPRIFGVDDSGTVEAGAVADLVIWDADPFELNSYPQAVFIGGTQVPMTSRHTELRDRYLPRERTLPHAY
jgi:imidazolonepropionase-like amidohydrolase